MRRILITLISIIFLMSFVSAGDFKIQNITGTDLFILNATGDLTITGTFFGNFAGLSTYNSTYDMWSYNQTTATFNLYNATWDNNADIISNVTAINTRIGNVNTTGNLQELLNSTGIYSTYNETYAGFGVNGTTISYHNITDIPTCLGGQSLSFNGTDLVCSDSGNFTNVAYTNITNTFAENQIFSKDVNITGNMTLMTDTSFVKGIVDNVGMKIDSSGNIIFVI